MDLQCPAELSHCPHAERSAELAVKKVFAILGVDIDRPEQVECFREDLRFGRHMRRAADRGLLAMVAVMAAGIVTAAWIGITSKLPGVQ